MSKNYKKNQKPSSKETMFVKNKVSKGGKTVIYVKKNLNNRVGN